MSGDILEYTPRSVRGNRCKIETHKPHIQRMVLDHLNLEESTHFVNIITEEDQKQIDEIYYSSTVTPPPIYYGENTQDTPFYVFVQSYEEQKENFFQSCQELLEKARTLYYSLSDSVRSLKRNDEDYEFDNILDARDELEVAIWQLSNSLGISIILPNCDPQRNTSKKMSKNPTRTILYYTRSIEACQNKLYSI